MVDVDVNLLTFEHNVEIEFPSKDFCEKVINVLGSEINTHLSESTIEYKMEDKNMKVLIRAINAKTLRIKVNALYETCYLISTLLEDFMS